MIYNLQHDLKTTSSSVSEEVTRLLASAIAPSTPVQLNLTSTMNTPDRMINSFASSPAPGMTHNAYSKRTPSSIYSITSSPSPAIRTFSNPIEVPVPKRVKLDGGAITSDINLLKEQIADLSKQFLDFSDQFLDLEDKVMDQSYQLDKMADWDPSLQNPNGEYFIAPEEGGYLRIYIQKILDRPLLDMQVYIYAILFYRKTVSKLY